MSENAVTFGWALTLVGGFSLLGACLAILLERERTPSFWPRRIGLLLFCLGQLVQGLAIVTATRLDLMAPMTDLALRLLITGLALQVYGLVQRRREISRVR